MGIKEETDDIIILRNYDILKWLFVGFLIVLFLPLDWLIFDVPIALALIIFFSIQTVTIDKNLQSIIIKNNSIFSGEKIPFSGIKEIELMRHGHDPEWGDSWSINIITSRRESLKIFSTEVESDADRLVGKISGITGKELSFQSIPWKKWFFR